VSTAVEQSHSDAEASGRGGRSSRRGRRDEGTAQPDRFLSSDSSFSSVASLEDLEVGHSDEDMANAGENDAYHLPSGYPSDASLDVEKMGSGRASQGNAGGDCQRHIDEMNDLRLTQKRLVNEIDKMNNLISTQKQLVAWLVEMLTGINCYDEHDYGFENYKKNRTKNTILSTADGMGFNTGSAKKGDWQLFFKKCSEWMAQLLNARESLTQKKMHDLLKEMVTFFDTNKASDGFGESSMVKRNVEKIREMARLFGS
jgi:hypothetical protein